MSERKLLAPPPAVAMAYGEPWRVGRNGCLVSDERSSAHLGGDRFGDRAYYGGTLLAESMSRSLAARAADCVNFCAGVEFRPGQVYAGALLDVLDALETLHARMPEPITPSFDDEDREYFRLWRDVDELLRQFGRDRFARMNREGVSS